MKTWVVTLSGIQATPEAAEKLRRQLVLTCARLGVDARSVTVEEWVYNDAIEAKAA